MDQTNTEEKWNVISHSLGIILAIIGFLLLLQYDNHKTAYSTLSILIYSLSLIILYTASTLYHMVSKRKLKEKFRIFDHISIYLLIAGSYTPVCLITLERGNGWTIFIVVWLIAFMGIILKLFFTGKYEVLSLILYLFMGWLIVFDIGNLINNLSEQGLILLASGGFFYTAGIIFYVVKRIPYNHVIWHFFVLGGSISHWCMIFFNII